MKANVKQNKKQVNVKIKTLIKIVNILFILHNSFNYFSVHTLMYLLVSVLVFVGINDATIRAHTTRNAPNTNGGPGTNWKYDV